MPALVRILLSVTLTGLPALAAAGPRTIADCERIEAADAYNRCLASFGPPGRSLRLEPSDTQGGAVPIATSVEPQPSVPKVEKARLARKSTRHGSATRRVIRAERMVFSVASDRTRVR